MLHPTNDLNDSAPEETVRDKRLRMHGDLSLVTEASDATPPVQKALQDNTLNLKPLLVQHA